MSFTFKEFENFENNSEPFKQHLISVCRLVDSEDFKNMGDFDIKSHLLSNLDFNFVEIDQSHRNYINKLLDSIEFKEDSSIYFLKGGVFLLDGFYDYITLINDYRVQPSYDEDVFKVVDDCKKDFYTNERINFEIDIKLKFPFF